jgi:hypothetical protein
MKFGEFLKIRGSRTSYILMPLACVASFYLAGLFYTYTVAILFAMLGTCMMISTFNIVYEHRLYRTVSNPTFTIYERMMGDLEKIQITNKAAVYGFSAGTIVYRREMPGYLENEQFESFSLVEKQIIEYPFRQAILKHQAHESKNKELSLRDRAHRNDIKRYTDKQ